MSVYLRLYVSAVIAIHYRPSINPDIVLFVLDPHIGSVTELQRTLKKETALPLHAPFRILMGYGSVIVAITLPPILYIISL